MANFQEELRREAQKHIVKFEYYARELRDDDKRRERRTGKPHRGKIWHPEYWAADPAFNPYHVRSSCSKISYAVESALRSHAYRPYNPIAYQVPKVDGSSREVSVFSIADATVSRRIYRSLLTKNKSRLSAYSYAYRDDLTAHNAIQHITSDFKGRSRLFVAEYDFSKYFNSISHQHLWQMIDEKNFLITDLERLVLQGFLETSLQSQDSYDRHRQPEVPVSEGVPQGTSVSLFLANVAAWDIDRALERLGVGFARYADDTLIWSHDYGRLCEAVDVLNALSSELGAALNLKKSEGISLFTTEPKVAEMKPKSVVEFVGYRFQNGHTGMRDRVTDRIKKRISYLVWSNLLEPLKKNQLVPKRVLGPVDRDYYVMLLQIRRYLYGNLTEEKLARLRSGRAKKINYPGVMSFFPLLDDLNQLKRMDGWLLETIHNSLRARAKILHDKGLEKLPTPHGLSIQELSRASAATDKGTLDLRVPSFVRISTVIRAAAAHGANVVGRRGGPQLYQYGD